MGRVQDIEYFSSSSEPCMPDMEKMHCCSTELELIKLEEDQNQSFFNLSEKQLIEIQTLPALFEFSLLFSDIEENEISDNYDLPPPRTIPAYKLFCNYTYYG